MKQIKRDRIYQEEDQMGKPPCCRYIRVRKETNHEVNRKFQKFIDVDLEVYTFAPPISHGPAHTFTPSHFYPAFIHYISKVWTYFKK